MYPWHFPNSVSCYKPWFFKTVSSLVKRKLTLKVLAMKKSSSSSDISFSSALFSLSVTSMTSKFKPLGLLEQEWFKLSLVWTKPLDFNFKCFTHQLNLAGLLLKFGNKTFCFEIENQTNFSFPETRETVSILDGNPGFLIFSVVI